MYWTKPGPLGGAEVTVLYPNRRVNGTNLELMGIESIRGSVASISYGEEGIIANEIYAALTERTRAAPTY